MTKREYKQKLKMQRLIGFVLLIISIVIIIVASNGNPADPYGNDATAILITAPLGVYSIVTTKIFIM